MLKLVKKDMEISLIEKYHKEIENKVKKAYEVASKARKLNYDPEPYVDIPIAKDVAERVEGLISAIEPRIMNSGVAKRIRELEKIYGANDWRVGLTIAKEVAKGRFFDIKNEEKGIELGIRVGLAYLTLAVVSAPLEGFLEAKIKKRRDGKKYLAIYFGGPIRAAGGTASAVTVLLADYLRKQFNLLPYDISEEEIERYKLEIETYHEHVARLQYFPSKKELEFLLKKLPVEITGDPTSEKEVLAYKDLERVETNKIRGGMALVLAEGVAQKAKKILKNIKKWGKDFDLDDWLWLEEFLKIQKEEHAGKEKNKEEKVKPNYRYIEEAVAGRPIFSYPLAKGGFRLRYGRGRVNGLASYSINPATMVVLDDFIAIGSQLRVERPGKATAITTCTNIEGPIVKLKNGEVRKLKTIEEAIKVKNDIVEILFLGDLLISVGEFLENNHVILPSSWVEEWYDAILEEKGIKKPKNFKEMIEISLKYKIPIHPEYTYHYKDVPKNVFISILKKIKEGEVKEGSILIENDPIVKKGLELLCIPHKLENNKIIIEGNYSKGLLYSIGYYTIGIDKAIEIAEAEKENCKDSLELINKISPFPIKDKIAFTIGARLGRPEKAKMRALTGKPHGLFVVGEQGGRMRSLNEAIANGYVEGDFPIYYCKNCKEKRIFAKCEICNSICERYYLCSVCGKLVKTKVHCNKKTIPYERRRIKIREIVEACLKRINEKLPTLVKGVRGLSNEDKTVERIEKAILRAKYKLTVNKDGTIRYDAIEVPITHFKPKEIGTSVEKLKELGYTKDIFGNPLTNEDQILELFPQDIILPNNSFHEGALDVFYRVANFVDDELEKLYGLKRYYNLKTKEDLIGKLIIGLAPHTSAGIVGRIIGFTDTQGFFAHPFFHAAMRRNCDGDEAAIILLMDALLNFSRKYLPNKRGSRTMDAPLVLTVKLIPKEVDKEAFNLEITEKYSSKFFEKTQEYCSGDEIRKYVKIVEDILDDNPYDVKFNLSFDTININLGTKVSAYKLLPTMIDKIKKQMSLTNKIRAVDKDDAAKIIIEKHFLKDIRGNLRKFSTQMFRCVQCNEKYRRPPLEGVCPKCGGRIIFTVTEGGVNKYVEPSFILAEAYNLPKSLKQRLELLKMRIESLFGKEKEKQTNLKSFFIKKS